MLNIKSFSRIFLLEIVEIFNKTNKKVIWTLAYILCRLDNFTDLNKRNETRHLYFKTKKNN